MTIHEFGSYFQYHDLLAGSTGKCLRITYKAPRSYEHYVYIRVKVATVNDDTDSDNYKQDWIRLIGIIHVTDHLGEFLLDEYRATLESPDIKEIVEITSDEFSDVNDCKHILDKQIEYHTEQLLEKYRYEPKVTDSATA